MNILSKETNAIELEDGTCICPKCGSNKRFKFHAHADGKGVFINYYHCTECNESIFFKAHHDWIFEIKLKEKDKKE